MDRRYSGKFGGSHVGMSMSAASNRPYSVTRHVSAADQIAQVDNELLFLSADDARRHRGMGVRLDKDAHRRFLGGNPTHSSDDPVGCYLVASRPRIGLEETRKFLLQCLKKRQSYRYRNI